MAVEVHLIRYSDYHAYLHLIQYISTKGSITQEDFRRFASTEKEFILVVTNEMGQVFMTAKINYLFRFSKQKAHDMFIQDLVYDPNCSQSVIEGYEAIFQYCKEHEERLGIRMIGRRIVLMNPFIFAHELILKRYEVEFI